MSQRDPVALAVSLLNFLVVLGGFAWYGGRLEQRVTVIEEGQREERAAARDKVDLDAVQTTQIQLLQSDVRYMKQMLEKIDRKIPDRDRERK